MIARLRTILADPRTEWVVLALILVNAVILGLETSPTVMNAVGPALRFVDAVILTIFVIEIASRMIVHRLAFFRDPWSVFDFLVVGIALVPATDNLSVLRALRVLRVLRLITVVPALRRVVGGLIGRSPGHGLDRAAAASRLLCVCGDGDPALTATTSLSFSAISGGPRSRCSP